MNPRRIVAGIVIAALASVLVYAALAFLTDAGEMAAALRAFPLQVFVGMLALNAVSFTLRGIRWGALMRAIGYPVSTKDALYLHFSGQTMAVTPGRVGEVLKPWLASNVAGMPMTRGIALVFSERLADLIAVCFLSLGGLWTIGGNMWALVMALGVIVAGTAVASSRRFHEVALKFIEGREWAKRHHASASAISSTIQRALTWRTMAWSVPASVVAWGLEGLGFAWCLHTVGFTKFGVLGAISVHAVSAIVGAFTFLPGGIGLTEASMVGILVAAGMPGASASAATMIQRLATLWWSVGLGWIALASRPSLFRQLLAAPDASDLDG